MNLAPLVFDVAGRIVDRLVQSPVVPVDRGHAPAVEREVVRAIEKEVVPRLEHLTNNEPAIQSRVTQGAVGSMMVAVGSVLVLYAQDTLTPEILTAQGSIFASACWTLYGRWRARKPLGA